MQRAVVIGGSIAGLMTAKTLSPFFREVIILEKDTLNSENGLHKGVGQGPHSHVLLPSGMEILKQLLDSPEFNPREYGIYPADAAEELKWFQFGVWKKRFHSGVNMGWCHRSQFEWRVRQDVLSVDNIQLSSTARVVGLMVAEEGNRIKGVQYQTGSGKEEIKALEADLVIDASGRGTHTPKWLSEANIASVTEDEVRTQISYTTRRFRLPPSLKDSLDWKVLAIYPEPPHVKRGGMIYPLGNGEWMTTLVGFNGEIAPSDIYGYMDYAQSLPQPELYEVLKQSTPIGDPLNYRVPGSLWRRYDDSKQWPDNYAVVGDAVCSFNPIYGQGITMVLKDLQKLRALLERKESDFTPATMTHLQKQIGKGKIIPGLMAASPDFMYTGTTGNKPPGVSIMNSYIKALMKLAGKDQDIHQRFIEAFTFLKSPTVLMTPGVIGKVVVQKLFG
ncbi:NAD(P)/FAD-dependent oxidoreductase [Endozoicomonas atrinae]|uniref:NAD(P)/FAD-dependent oxidoreductase n=1 Tax=Endozoicomonas atrinae TaxID=1333660 RepID=UPI003B00909E